MREQSIGVTHEQLQQLILGPCEAGELPGDEYPVVGGIELQLRELELDLGELQRLRLAVKVGASHQCAQTSPKLQQVEGLHHVVIRTRLEAGDTVADVGPPPEHQYRHTALKAASSEEHLQPVDIGQVPPKQN